MFERQAHAAFRALVHPCAFIRSFPAKLQVLVSRVGEFLLQRPRRVYAPRVGEPAGSHVFLAVVFHRAVVLQEVEQRAYFRELEPRVLL